MPWVGELIQIKEDNKNKAYKSMPGRVVGEVMNEMRNECVLHSFSFRSCFTYHTNPCNHLVKEAESCAVLCCSFKLNGNGME